MRLFAALPIEVAEPSRVLVHESDVLRRPLFDGLVPP
jgi:hypothetical protein